MAGWLRLLIGLVVATALVVGIGAVVLVVTDGDVGEACETLLPGNDICPSDDEPLADPVAAIDAATGQAGINFVKAPDLRWRQQCGPADEVLGRELYLGLSLPGDFAVPGTWREVGPGAWETAEGARVVVSDDGSAEVSAPASADRVEASDRVVAGSEFGCG